MPVFTAIAAACTVASVVVSVFALKGSAKAHTVDSRQKEIDQILEGYSGIFDQHEAQLEAQAGTIAHLEDELEKCNARKSAMHRKIEELEQQVSDCKHREGALVRRLSKVERELTELQGAA